MKSSSRGLLLLLGVLSGGVARAQPPDFFAPSTSSTESEADRDAQVLERFVVEEVQLPGRHWRYVSLPGYEVLTRCDDAQNAYYLAALQREARVEAGMLPHGFLTPPEAVNSVILYDRRPSAGELAFTIPLPSEIAADDATLWGKYAGTHLMGSGVGEDIDTRADCLNLWGRNLAGSLYTTRSFSTRLLHRTPTLPGWFIQGLIGPVGLYKPGYRFITPDGAEDRTESFVYFPSALWISDAKTAALRKNPDEEVSLLPLDELLRPRAWSEYRSPLESSELSLFVRWGLYGPRARREDFLQFVTRSEREEPTEALFRSCFAMGFEQARGELKAYLPKAVTSGVRFRIAAKDNLPIPATRNATADETARLIGDWERINGIAVRPTHPELAELYFTAAGLVLEKRYREGGRDPKFLGVFGLYQHAVGNDVRSEPALEAAALDPNARPNVLVTLARLKLAGIQQGTGSVENLETARTLLRRATRRPPALVETYRVWAQAALRSPDPRSAENVTVLAEGERLFPADTEFRSLVVQVRGR